MARVPDKTRRHRDIVELVRRRAIGSQEELVRALEDRRHSVSQATLSRDLKELRISRVPVNGGYRYLPAGEEGLIDAPPSHRFTGLEVVAVECNETAVVIRTRVGHAQGVAVALDDLRLPDILATVAGDDTILVVPRSVRQSDAVRRRLAELFELA